MNWKLIMSVFVFLAASALFANSAAAQYVQTNLVSDPNYSPVAPITDPNLINAWGMTKCRINNL